MTQLFHFEPQPDAPIICDFAGATDTPDERLAECGRLFQTALVSRHRTPDSAILTFAPEEGVAAWIADLAAREAACCPFMKFDVSADETEIRWETSGGPEIQPILDEYYTMYEAAARSTEELLSRLATRGFDVHATGPTRYEYVRPEGRPADEANQRD